MPVDVLGIVEKQDMMLGLDNSVALAAGRLHLAAGSLRLHFSCRGGRRAGAVRTDGL